MGLCRIIYEQLLGIKPYLYNETPGGAEPIETGWIQDATCLDRPGKVLERKSFPADRISSSFLCHCLCKRIFPFFFPTLEVKLTSFCKCIVELSTKFLCILTYSYVLFSMYRNIV